MEKNKLYQRLFDQLGNLLGKTGDMDARMATVCAVLHHKLGNVLWTGFYSLKNGELLVRTYQGPLACQVLEKDKGVCWAAINRKQTVVVPDVHHFEGHIACDPRSLSEIVIPVVDKGGNIIGVLDIDSTKPGRFDRTDAAWLEKITGLLHL
jgi:L-methionine (R)-S-oxide reductase